MTNNQDKNQLHNERNAKKERKEGSQVSIIFIALMLFLLAALLIYIYFKP